MTSAASFEARLAAVRGTYGADRLDVLLVTYPPNVRYLSGHTGTAGALLVARDAVSLLVDARYRESARQLVDGGGAPAALRVVDVPGSYDAALLARCLADGHHRIGVEAEHLSVSRLRWFERMGASSPVPPEWVPVTGLVEGARIIKDPQEQEALRRAARGLTAVADAAFRAARAGVRERDVAGAIEAALRASGFEKPAFDTIVASGPNSALPHYRAGDRFLATGDLVVLDFGGVMDGYCSDITRTVAIGPPGTEARRVYGAVLKAQQAAIEAVRPGQTAEAVDVAARNVLTEEGLGAAFGHGTGHGLGLDVHEAPRVGKPLPEVAPVPLAAGMVLTVEPGAYLPGWGGVRIEDDILVTPGGHEVLTAVTRELVVL